MKLFSCTWTVRNSYCISIFVTALRYSVAGYAEVGRSSKQSRHLLRKAGCRVGYFWHHRARKQCEIRGQSKSAFCFSSLLHILAILMLSTLQKSSYTQKTQSENRFISSSRTYLHCKSFKKKKKKNPLQSSVAVATDPPEAQSKGSHNMKGK